MPATEWWNDADWWFEASPVYTGTHKLKPGDIVAHVAPIGRDPTKADLHLVLDTRPTTGHYGLTHVEIRLLRIGTTTEETCSSKQVPAFWLLLDRE